MAEGSADRTATSEAVIDVFGHLVAQPDASIDLGLGALLIARQEYPDLDSTDYLGQLDDMALELRRRGATEGGEVAAIQALNQYLFQDLGFRGNQRDYYDPRNSFLNDVLDRRMGIPISLSVVYLEVGRRLGLALEGVAFPGHFLVKLALPEGEVMLDPYAQGVSLGVQELEERAEQTLGAHGLLRIPLSALLQGTGNKAILARMLRNLKAIYLQREHFDRALTVAQWLLRVAPDDSEELRDRGMIYHRLECFRAAAADFRSYLKNRPDAPDAMTVRAHLIEAQAHGSRLN